MKIQTNIDIQPFVSVIIPFKDNHDEVSEIQKRLAAQTYPREKIEIMLIDNGSKKIFEGIQIDGYQSKLLKEEDYENSPYSARNRGIEAARGVIIAFIDANSLPEPDWVEQGVTQMMQKEADLIAGDVRFTYGKKATAAMVADSMTSIQMENAVLNRGVAYTANLFVKKKVFDQIGLFEEGIRSGGDVRFTGKATSTGFQLMYCKEAVVYKKARGCNALYRKKIRTGKGYFYTWKDEIDKPIWFYNFFRSLKPKGIPKINNDYPDVNRIILWFHLYLTGVLEQISFIFEYFRYTLGRQRDLDRRTEMKNSKS